MTNVNAARTKTNRKQAKKAIPTKLGHRIPLPRPPILRFSPTAWAKLLYLCNQATTEIGGFGISLPEDLLSIEDVQLVRQSCTVVSVKFDDAAVADFFDEQVDLGRRPEQFARIWIHTHPGDSADPSGVDEETFQRVFGNADWAVMAILAQGGKSYARLRFNVGPGGELRIPVQVDYQRPFIASDYEAWEQELQENVKAEDSFSDFDAIERLEPDPFLPEDFYDFGEAWNQYVEQEQFISGEREAYD